MTLYFGLDGDSIGREIESFLITNDIDRLKDFSNKIVIALNKIKTEIEKKEGVIIFCAGDSILFYGNFDSCLGDKILKVFNKETGRTASVGIGDSIAKAYLGLKLAKSQGGNQSIYFKDL